MALNPNEMYLLAHQSTLHQKVEMLGIIVAGEVISEDPNLLVGGLTEHKLRFEQAMEALDPSRELVLLAAKGVAVSLRDILTVPTGEEPLGNRIALLANSIDDNLILDALRANWSSVAGFDTVGWIAENP